MRLAINQVMIFVLVAVSCAAQMKSTDAEFARAFEQSQAQLSQMPAGTAEVVQSLGSSLVYVVFGVILGISLVFQGTMAVYYLTRRKRIREFHEELPPWVRDIVTTVVAR